LPTPEELEVAELFLRKAASDLAAARTLAAAPDQQDDVVGFHAQQAVEKSLKAVVTIRRLEIPLTHDIDLLLRLLEAGIEKPPDDFQEAKSLSPWAVEMRYARWRLCSIARPRSALPVPCSAGHRRWSTLHDSRGPRAIRSETRAERSPILASVPNSRGEGGAKSPRRSVRAPRPGRRSQTARFGRMTLPLATGTASGSERCCAVTLRQSCQGGVAAPSSLS
jgi:HEPN domain-containing protein